MVRFGLSLLLSVAQPRGPNVSKHACDLLIEMTSHFDVWKGPDGFGNDASALDATQ